MLVARYRWSTADEGDLAGDQSAAHPEWTWLHQIHGGDVVLVGEPGEHAGADADAAVTAAPGCVLAVRTADCAPIVLLGDQSVGVVHAGWRGVVAGVIPAAVAALQELSQDGGVRAVLGPCIRVGCYEFDGPERGQLAEQFGPTVLGATTWGTPALDLPAAVHRSLAAAGVTDVTDESGCTACDTRWYSHRARGDTARFATTAWLEPS